MRVGLALGGGGARGFAHIGVLEVFEREKIPVNIVSGTSMGAVVAALYATEKDVGVVKKKVFTFVERDIVKQLEEKFSSDQKKSKSSALSFKKPILFVRELYLWNRRIIKKWLIDYKPFEVLFKEAIDDLQFSDCKIPFLCVATDLVAGKEVYLEEGLLRNALLASTALPGVFPPLRLNEKFLVDGGILESIPVACLKKRKVDYIIAVSLERKRRHKSLKSSKDILFSIDEIRHNKLVEISKSWADALLEPDTSNYGWADFSCIKEIIEKGREEAERRVPLIKKKLRFRRFFSFLQ